MELISRKEAKARYTKEWKKRNRARLIAYKQQWDQRNRRHVLEYARAYREANRELLRERSKQWHRENPDKARIIERSWRKRNRVKVRQYANNGYYRHHEKRKAEGRERYKTNREQMIERAVAWGKANRQRRKEIVRRYAERHPDRIRLNSSLGAARRKNADGRFNLSDINRLFDLQEGKCAYYKYCNTLLNDGFDIDHIHPLVKGGTNWPSNLQLCCDSCNSRKGKLTDEQFVARLEREKVSNGAANKHARRRSSERNGERGCGAHADVARC